VAKTVLALARLALEGREVLDHSQLEKAIQTFEKLGAQVDLDQLGELSRKLAESGV
jgi:hypothetical protein